MENNQNAKSDAGKIRSTGSTETKRRATKCLISAFTTWIAWKVRMRGKTMNDQSAKGDEEMLKPCPFCGAPASAWSWNGGARVDCSRWYSDPTATRVHFVGIGAKTPEEAIKIWNARSEQA